MWYIVIIVLWVVGMIVAYTKVSKWNNTVAAKVSACVLWPLVLILYGIHVLHNREW